MVKCFVYLKETIEQDYDPQLIIISCGFDAAEDDTVGKFKLSPGFFGHMTRVSEIQAEYYPSFTSDCYFQYNIFS